MARRFLIVGNAKTGTTVISHAVMHAAGIHEFQLEPKTISAFRQLNPVDDCVVKILFGQWMARLDTLDAIIDGRIGPGFTDILFIIRDPRASEVSALLYWPYNHFSHAPGPQGQADAVLDVYCRKEADPQGISIRSMMHDLHLISKGEPALCLRGEEAARVFDGYPQDRSSVFNGLTEYIISRKVPSSQLIRYEDFIAGRVDDHPLGPLLKGSRQVSEGLERTRRTGGNEDWTSFVTPLDLNFFNRKHAATIDHFGYPQSVELGGGILAENCSDYVRGIIANALANAADTTWKERTNIGTTPSLHESESDFDSEQQAAMEVHKSLWNSACAVEAELATRIAASCQPPPELERRFNGGVAPEVAKYYAAVLRLGDLPEDARILDLGCGFGRIALELVKCLGPKQRYFGIDPNVDGINWAQQNIAAHHPNFSFQHLDIKSQPYNPAGVLDGRNLRLPFDDASLDLVFMISVLTHVDLATVENYVREAARVLKPDTGRLVTTAFLLDDEVEDLIALGQAHLKMPWPHGASRVENPTRPELAIAHPRQALLDMLASAGFDHVSVSNGFWSGRPSVRSHDFQDLLIAARHPVADHIPSWPSVATGEAPDPAHYQLYNRIAAMTGGNKARLGRFVTWSNAVTLNAFWCQCAGLTLGPLIGGASGVEAQDRIDPWALCFEPLRQLGLESSVPAGSCGDSEFPPLDDGAMIALLVQLGRSVSREALHACFIAAAENGLRILDALTAGTSLMLMQPGGPARPAHIYRLDD